MTGHFAAVQNHFAAHAGVDAHMQIHFAHVAPLVAAVKNENAHMQNHSAVHAAIAAHVQTRFAAVQNHFAAVQNHSAATKSG